MRKKLFRVTAAAIALSVGFLGFNVAGLHSFAAEEVSITSAESGFKYVHDPRLNEKAMEDIIEDPDAIYGFSPNPDSARLGSYAKFDWSDPAVVEGGRQDRIAYHNSIGEMYTTLAELKEQGKSTEEIARTISNLRNEIRLKAAADDPEQLAAQKESNLAKYGNEMGPTPDSLYEKYGSWETVIDKAFSVNSGMDACLGLYDDYYEVYVAAGQVPADPEPAEPKPEEPAQPDPEPAEPKPEEPAQPEPKPAEPVPVEPAPVTKTYTVQAGDCLFSIAAKVYGDGSKWNDIYALNKTQISNPNLIFVGQVLVLEGTKAADEKQDDAKPEQPEQSVSPAPAANTYIVVKGDYLMKIAKKVLGDSSRWEEIFALNRDKISDPDIIYVGQILSIPQ